MKANEMVLLDYSDAVVGNALKMMLGLKNIGWQRREGLAAEMASSCAIQTETVTLLGETACIIMLEDTLPANSLFPNGNRGMPMALAHWRDKIATITNNRSLKAHAALVLRQIHDGRDYLQGPDPSLADINSAAWILETGLENDPTSPEMLTSWCKRMRALLEFKGTGKLVVNFKEDQSPKSATACENGYSAHGLSITITGESDTLVYGKLTDDSRVITSPLSHVIN